MYLLDPRNTSNRVAVGRISGTTKGNDLFHFHPVPKGWYKIDVTEVMEPTVPLMRPQEFADQYTLGDTANGNTLWKEENLSRYLVD